jgi:hypothetical protein
VVWDPNRLNQWMTLISMRDWVPEVVDRLLQSWGWGVPQVRQSTLHPQEANYYYRCGSLLAHLALTNNEVHAVIMDVWSVGHVERGSPHFSQYQRQAEVTYDAVKGHLASTLGSPRFEGRADEPEFPRVSGGLAAVWKLPQLDLALSYQYMDNFSPFTVSLYFFPAGPIPTSCGVGAGNPTNQPPRGEQGAARDPAAPLC